MPPRSFASSSRLFAWLSRPRVAGGVVFLLSFAAFLIFYLGHPQIDDTDSYFHLGLAREYAQEGLLAKLPWARFTSMAERWGDATLLFHLYLAPFAAWSDPTLGARVALALLDATIFGLLAALGVRALGAWGALLPLVPFGGSIEYASRLFRLRPEVFALPLFLAGAWLVAKGRYRWLGLLAAFFALSYSAVHAFLGAWVLVFLLWGWRDRRWEWALPLYATLGSLLGLVIHPRFPANLDTYLMTAQVLLSDHRALGGGPELEPHTTQAVFVSQLGLWLSLAAVWLSRRSAAPPADEDRRARDAFAVLGASFGLLYLMHSRFSFFAFPFGALWLVWLLRARGETIGRTVATLGRRVPSAAAAILCTAVFVITSARHWAELAERTRGGLDGAALKDRATLAAKIPDGARVATGWDHADMLVFYQPRAQYLEILDPLPMLLAHPAVHAAKEAVFTGSALDAPLTISEVLDSEFIVWSAHYRQESTLGRRLAGDPRVELLHDGLRTLARLHLDANRAMVLDWKVAPASAKESTDPASWLTYPLATTERGRRIEGFVNLQRLGEPPTCRVLVHEFHQPDSERSPFAISAVGPTRIWLDGRPVFESSGGAGFLVDRSVLEWTASPGTHRWRVRSCPATANGAAGFYFIRLPRHG